MIISGIYRGPLPVVRVYRGRELMWWAAEDREFRAGELEIRTVFRAAIDQSELEDLAMGCGVSVRTTAAMAQQQMIMIGGTGVMMLLEVTANQSPSAPATAATESSLLTDANARAGVARAACADMMAEAVANAAMCTVRIRPHWAVLSAQERSDAALRVSPSCPQGMDICADAAFSAELSASAVAPAAGHMDSRTRHDADMSASQVRRAAAEIAGQVHCTAVFHNSQIELITIGGAAVDVTADAELRAAESLAVTLLSRAAVEIGGALVQSSTVHASADSRVALTPVSSARQGLSRPQTAASRGYTDLAAEVRLALPRNASGQMLPMVAAQTGLTIAKSIAAAAQQTVAASMDATMADTPAKAPVTGTGAMARQTVTLSSWAGPVQRVSNLLIRQAIHVTQEGKTLYIK